MIRAILLAACLLTGSVQAEGLFGERAEPGQMPSRFVQFELVSDATILTSHWSRLVSSDNFLRVTYQAGRLRAGLSAGEFWMDGVLRDWNHLTILPVHAGFVIWSNPKKTWLCYGQVPNVYVQATGGFISYAQSGF
jgi:hypothetical protein